MGAIPSLILLFGSLLLPDTPNSLVQRGRADEGKKVLQVRVCWRARRAAARTARWRARCGAGACARRRVCARCAATVAAR
jgi:hypothetical protein